VTFSKAHDTGFPPPSPHHVGNRHILGSGEEGADAALGVGGGGEGAGWDRDRGGVGMRGGVEERAGEEDGGCGKLAVLARSLFLDVWRADDMCVASAEVEGGGGGGEGGAEGEGRGGGVSENLEIVYGYAGEIAALVAGRHCQTCVAVCCSVLQWVAVGCSLYGCVSCVVAFV